MKAEDHRIPGVHWSEPAHKRYTAEYLKHLRRKVDEERERERAAIKIWVSRDIYVPYKVKLVQDKIKQNEFFNLILLSYSEGDERIISLLNEYRGDKEKLLDPNKARKKKPNKTIIEEKIIEKELQKREETIFDFNLSDSDVSEIYDFLEEEDY